MCTGPWPNTLRPIHVELKIGLMQEWSVPKILLFRVTHDLSASLISELSRAGYDVATPESADVRTVLEQQPDLILLQTDVRTLDCCGLLTQLKGNEATAPGFLHVSTNPRSSRSPGQRGIPRKVLCKSLHAES